MQKNQIETKNKTKNKKDDSHFICDGSVFDKKC